MPVINLVPPLIPRRGATLETMLICRVSNPGPGKQDVKSNADQEAEYRKWIEDRVDFPVNVTVIAGTGSGEYLDREESEQTQAEIETGKYDLVIAEDLGRIFRRMHAFLFCEEAEDFGTRVIAPNDHVDTARDDWRLSAFFAALRHEMYNADTAKRIRRTLRNRFQQGEVFQCEIAGYVKPQKASPTDKIRDSQVSKDPAAEAVYDEWFTMLEKGATFAEVADWLNTIGFRTGPYCRTHEWDGPMVGRYSYNPMLKGIRVRNNRKSQRINRTGRRRSIKAPPEERLERECPHLAFIEPKRYDRVIRLVRKRNSKYRRNETTNGDAPRRGPRRRTRWPGQHLFCACCRNMFVWGGHGQRDHLMCDGCRHYHCWQAISVDGPLASTKLIDAIFNQIEQLPGFDSMLQQTLRAEADVRAGIRTRRIREIDRETQSIQRELDNVIAFIRGGQTSRRLADEIELLENHFGDLEHEREDLVCEPQEAPSLPPMDRIKQLARESMQAHTDDPYAFGRLMRSWIPRINVVPYRLFDGGEIVLRAFFQLNLAPLVADVQHLDAFQRSLSTSLVVDLFDPPNQRDRFRTDVVRLKEDGLTEPKIAAELQITKTAVQRAAALQRKMDERGLVDPYVPVLEPPEDYKRLRRHKHPRYRFQPLDQWQR